MFKIFAFLIYGALVLLLGCQTPPLKDYKKITLGMEKHDVLELMGSPTFTQRWQGRDRWRYVFYDSEIRLEKEVHFFENHVIYLGDPLKPEVSAEEQDRRNELKGRPREYVNYILEKEKERSENRTPSDQSSEKPKPVFAPVQ